jgi:hypothetical protein
MRACGVSNRTIAHITSMFATEIRDLKPTSAFRVMWTRLCSACVRAFVSPLDSAATSLT